MYNCLTWAGKGKSGRREIASWWMRYGNADKESKHQEWLASKPGWSEDTRGTTGQGEREAGKTQREQETSPRKGE